MNKRIEDIARKVAENLDPEDCMVSEEFLEAFAKMIALDCAGIACDYDLPKMSGPGMIIAGLIEDHYGIEDEQAN